MIRRIISYFNNSEGIVSTEELMNAPSVVQRLFKDDSQIKKQTVVEYCYKLAKAGWIYVYGGIYLKAQKIPINLTITELNNSEMDDETKLQYEYNRLHSLRYPNIPNKLRKAMSMLNHLHLMQFRHNKCFDFFDFWDYMDKDGINIQKFVSKMIEYEYLSKSGNTIEFTGKYIPYSVDLKTLIAFNDKSISDEEIMLIEAKIDAEREIIEANGTEVLKYKEWKVPTIDKINFVRSYIKGFDYLSEKERLEFINGLYKSIEVFDKYD